MSSSKDRLGRNPFDRGTYKASANGTSKAKPRTKNKAAPKAKRASAGRARKAAPPTWRLILDELDRRSPPLIRQLKICKRVAAFAEMAAARFYQVARHLEA
jgi:hypothetical protein